MAKGGGTTRTSQTSTVDPATQRYIEEYRRRAAGVMDGGAGGADLNAARSSAQRMASAGLGFAGQTGLGGLDSYMNPYESSVIAGVRDDFSNQRAQADKAAADMATRSGAFGGDREAVLRAESARGVNQAETATLANLRAQGFNDAAARLQQDRMQQGQMGMAGLSQLFGLGQHLDQRQLAALQAMTGGFTPGSQTMTGTQTTPGQSPFQTLLGAGLTLGGAGALGPLAGLLGPGLNILRGGIGGSL